VALFVARASLAGNLPLVVVLEQVEQVQDERQVLDLDVRRGQVEVVPVFVEARLLADDPLAVDQAGPVKPAVSLSFRTLFGKQPCLTGCASAMP